MINSRQLILAAIVLTAKGEDRYRKEFKYDYCSIGDSIQVYDDVTNVFNEAFGGYDIPMDPYTCPFHPKNLKYIRDKMNFEAFRSARSVSKPTTTYKCRICKKSFKALDYFELHVKINHSKVELEKYSYKYGQDNRLSPMTRSQYDGMYDDFLDHDELVLTDQGS